MTRVVLGAYPYYPNNPWQDIVYSGASAAEIDVLHLDAIDALDWADAARADGKAPVLHINWTTPVTQSNDSIIGTIERVHDVISRLKEFKRAGGRIVWTVHNVLPHEMKFLGPELIFCQALSSLADLVQMINPDTLRLTAPYYELPHQRVASLPHPSYVGRFPDLIDRQAARAALGIERHEVAYLFLGTLRPYKGIEELVGAYQRLVVTQPNARLLVAGEVGGGYAEEDLLHLLSSHDGIRANVAYVPSDEVQTWCRAADVMVLPYRQALNVSVTLLAATFGLPVIVTRSDATRHLEGADWIRLIDPDADLALEVRSAADDLLATPGVRESARADAQKVAPPVVAARFVEQIQQLVG